MQKIIVHVHNHCTVVHLRRFKVVIVNNHRIHTIKVSVVQVAPNGAPKSSLKESLSSPNFLLPMIS